MAWHNYSPAIVDGKIARLSVSQLSTFNPEEHGGCNAKWWFKYIGKIPDPPKPAMQEGIDGHKRLETYYNTWDLDVLLPVDKPALPLLPELATRTFGPVPETESALKHLSLLSVPFQGSIDLVHGTDAYDYKYQSKIRVYAKPTAQLWGYLEELRLRNPEAKKLGFHYIYIQKTFPWRAKKSSMTPDGPANDHGQHFEPREVERRWQGYRPLVKEMNDVAAAKNVVKVPKNSAACYAFGPCPYLSICKHNNAAEEIDVMGFLEDLAAARAETPTPSVVLPDVSASLALPPDAPPPDAVPTAPQSPPPPPKRGPGRPKKLKIEDVSSAAAPAPAAVFDPNEVPDSSPSSAPKPMPPVLTATEPKLKSMTLAMTVGLPNYSSARAEMTFEGGTEEQMTAALEAALQRALKRAIPQVNAMGAEAKK